MSRSRYARQVPDHHKFFRAILVLGVSAAALLAGQAMAQTTPPDAGSDTPTEVVIKAKKLDAAQQVIQPDTGVSKYVFPDALIQALPGGDNVGLNQVILQAPGVAQDSYGQLHVRGDHNNIQFRLDGIILPEGLSNFGQVISPRYAQSIQLNTGALPAEYGLRTAAVINITTKTGLANGGTVSLYGGSHGDYEPSITYGGHSGNDTYFGSLSYQQNQLGIESPYKTQTPLHDRTAQVLGFGYYSHLIDDTSRVSLIAGVSDQSFQIPNTPGLNSVDDGTGFTVNGVPEFFSDHLQERQKETTDYIIASYLKALGNFTGQISLYARGSQLTYDPDWDAELAFNGVAQQAAKKDTTLGLQAEGAWVLNSHHTLRGGLIASTEDATSATVSHVFMLDANGNPTSDVPTVIDDNSKKTQNTLSLYVQDEWKPLDQLVLNYGLRYDRVEAYRTEDQVSPRLNFVWTPELFGFGATTIHGGYARYFTPPPFELIASQTQSLFVGTSFDISGRNDLPRAQRDNYYDLGIQQKFGKHFTFGIDSYERAARYLIDEGQFGAPIILTPFNYHYGRNKGTEFTINYENGPLTAYANLAVSSAQGMDIVSSQFNFGADERDYISNHFIYVDHNQTTSGSAGITYRFGRTRLAMDAIYGSGLRAAGNGIPNGARLPDYVQVNASLTQHLAWAGGLDARLDVINLFDRAYEIRDGSGIGVGAPQWGSRRGVFVGLSKNF